MRINFSIYADYVDGKDRHRFNMKFHITVLFESKGILLETPPSVFIDFCKQVTLLHDEDFSSFKREVLKKYRAGRSLQKPVSSVIDINEYRNERIIFISFGHKEPSRLHSSGSSLPFGKTCLRMWHEWNRRLDFLYGKGVVPGSKEWMEELALFRRAFTARLEGTLQSMLHVLDQGTKKEKEAAAFMLTYVTVSSREFSQIQKILSGEEDGEVQNAIARSLVELASRDTSLHISWKIIFMMIRHPLFRCKEKGLAMLEVKLGVEWSAPPQRVMKYLCHLRAAPSLLLQEHIQSIDRVIESHHT